MTKVKTTLPSGKASVANWEFDVTFLIKEQAAGLVTALVNEDIDFPVAYETDLDATRKLYTVHVGPMPWAENLVTLAKLLKKYDHKG